jgi:1-acyl-sn-glycerol-3-phosphate acyltransferase
MPAGSERRRVAWLACLAAAVFYRTDRIGGAVPAGAALLVANHPNGLLDPAVVWASAGRDICFLAKSTLFKGPLGPLMRAAGAIPVYRRMDTGEDASRNAEMFDAVQDALARREAVCLFPEGTSHSKGRLEQLRTGAARIALASAATGTPLAIVPVGLTFDRKARFRSRVTVAYGPAFGCDDLVADYRDDATGAVRALTERIAMRLRALIVEADPRSFEEIVARIDRLYAARIPSRSRTSCSACELTTPNASGSACASATWTP